MQARLLAFAHTRDQLGFSERVVDFTPGESAHAILSRVAPDLDFSGVRVAVDYEYLDWDTPIAAAQEIALIPPVSGG